MEKVLFVAHTERDGSLPRVALEVLGGAVKLAADLGASISVGLVGVDVKDAANVIAGCGAETFLAVTGSELEVSRYATDAAAFEALAKAAEATIVLAPGTPRISRSMPGVAQRMDGRIDTHVSGIDVADGAPQIERWYYRQRMVASLTRNQRPWFVLIDSGVLEPWDGPPGSAALDTVNVEFPAMRTDVEGVESPAVEAQTIRPDAEVLFVAGAGWTKKQSDGQSHIKDAESLILGFLDAGQASLGSSKSLVDQAGEGHEVVSFMTHMNQVGQTGSTPRHPKGLATCCHGEEPHVVGWRFINERRAVNLDAGCGWAQGKADVLYVADAFAVMEKVNELLG